MKEEALLIQIRSLQLVNYEALLLKQNVHSFWSSNTDNSGKTFPAAEVGSTL